MNAILLDTNAITAIKQALKAKGTPIPINDVWLAAQSMETGALLATYDRHFDNIDGLRIWTPPAV
jgi:tRNA(fMet)-specific endonuclease VapC